MYLLYSLLLTVGFVVLLPKFLVDALRNRKYVTGLGQRLGRLPTLPTADRPIIWLHCVSVGETEAARPLVASLLARLPSHQLVISTTTVTGQAVARKAFEQQTAAIFYFPLDLSWVVRRVLHTLKPSAFLIMETELWPNLLRECRRQSIPVALVNGRVSPKSFRRYQMIRRFMQRVLADLDIALMQSDQDARRIGELGLEKERILTPGNLKFDGIESPIDDQITEGLRRRYDLNESCPLIVCASTHGPEESLIIEAFKEIKRSHSNARLLIAPRHPERFDEVANLVKDSGLAWSRRSATASPADATCDAILLDSIGELRAVYSLAAIAFVGGSIAPHGGHNVLEPAARGVCVVTGPNTQNFAAITTALLERDAIVQLPEVALADCSKQLAEACLGLLADEPRRRSIGERALEVRNQNRGATERTVETLLGILKAPDPAETPAILSALQVTTAK